MSFNFWVDLTLALIGLTAAIVFIYQYKHGIIRRFRAASLRRKLVPALQALLPVISAELKVPQPDLYPLFRQKADMELLVTRSFLLFEDERGQLIRFLTSFSAVIAKTEKGSVSNNDIDDLVLLGQRTVLELSEIGY